MTDKQNYSGQTGVEIDRQIVQTLIDTKAIDFEALGAAIARFGPSSVLMDDDGWIRWCGNDFRLYKWPRYSIDIERLDVLRNIVRDLPSKG